MTLSQVCSRYFLFLSSLRAHCATSHITPSFLRRRLNGLLDECEEASRRHAAMHAKFERAKYALVALADEIILDSAWDHAHKEEWMVNLFETEHYGTAIAGERFYEMQDADVSDPELCEIYYLCLCLGFQGVHRSDPSKIVDRRRSLYGRLPDKLSKGEQRLVPKAYDYTDRRDFTSVPFMRRAKIAIIAITAAAFLLVLGSILFDAKVDEVIRAARGN